MHKDTIRLKNVLEKLYVKYNRRELIWPDPLQFVYGYSARGDMEIAALLAAVLAKQTGGSCGVLSIVLRQVRIFVIYWSC